MTQYVVIARLDATQVVTAAGPFRSKERAQGLVDIIGMMEQRAIMQGYDLDPLWPEVVPLATHEEMIEAVREALEPLGGDSDG